MNGTYRAVAGRIRRELDELGDVAERVSDSWEADSAENYHVDAAALNIHGFYAGLERIFEIIAGRIDETDTSGPHWHKELLDQMNTDIPGVRSAVISTEVRSKLDSYRGFRRVVRNVYSFDLDPQQVERLVKELPSVFEEVNRELRAFADTLVRVANEE